MTAPDLDLGLVQDVADGTGLGVTGVLTTGLLVLVVALIVALSLARRVWARHQVPTDRVVTLLAAGVALALSADGAYRLLTRGLGLPAWEATVVAAVAELALIAEAVRAERSIRRVGHPGGHQYAIAGIALGAGLVVSTNAASLPEWLVRFLVPQLAALLWWMGAREDITTHQADPAEAAGSLPAGRDGTTWLVSPRRLAVQAGLIASTDGIDDLAALTRARRVRALARLLHRHSHTTSTTLRRWRARRVHRLAEIADTATITAVADQLTRTRTVLAMAGLLTDPGTPVGATGAPVAPVALPGPSAAPLAPVAPLIAAVAPSTDPGGAVRDALRHPPCALGVAAPPAAVAAPVAASSSGGRPPRRARPGDVDRVRAALAGGDLTAPVTASAVAVHLGISREYAAAALHSVHQDMQDMQDSPAARSAPQTRFPQPAQREQTGAAAVPSGPDKQPTATAADHPRAVHVEDQEAAHQGLPPRPVTAAESFTHA